MKRTPTKRHMKTEQDLVAHTPSVEITEQPQAHSIRFRYASEGNSHGGLQGVSSQRGNKTFPTITVHNHHGPVRVVIELIAKDLKRGILPHAHELVGRECQGGIYTAVKMIDSPIADIEFRNLSIQHVTKKTLTLTLQKRMLMQQRQFPIDFQPTDAELRPFKDQAEELSKKLAMNTCRLCFRVFLCDQENRPVHELQPAVSDPVFDAKSPGAALLKICRIDRHAGGCQGGDEVFMLCDRVQKDDIEVQFYEVSDEAVTWQEFGKFNASDIHRQFAIVFTTPPYHDQTIMAPVTVFIRLRRPSDEEMSEPVKFTYQPNMEKDELDRKRRKTINLDLSAFPPRSTRGASRALNALSPSNLQMTKNGPGLGGSSRMASDLTADTADSDEIPGKLPEDVVTDAMPTSLGSQDPYDDDDASVHSAGDDEEDSVLSAVSAKDIEKGSLHSGEDFLAKDPMDRGELASRKRKWTDEEVDRYMCHYGATGNTRSLLYHLRHSLLATNQDGDSPLTLAVMHGHTETAINMIEVVSTLPTNSLRQQNNLGQSLLHICVINGRDDILKYVLSHRVQGETLSQHQVPLELADCLGNTVLHAAVRHGNTVALRAVKRHLLMLKNNFPAHNSQWMDALNTDGYSALHLAVRQQDGESVRLLVELGLDVNVADGRSGQTALHMAVLADDLSTTALLLSQGNIDVDVQCGRGLTALHHACRDENLAMTSLLMARQPNQHLQASFPDQEEETAPRSVLEMATDSGNLQLLRLLQGESLDDVASVKTEDSAERAVIEKATFGDLDRLDYMSRMRISLLMENDDWRPLADKLKLMSLVPYLQNSRNPVLALLDNFEIADGTVVDLYKAMMDVGRMDIAHFLASEFPEL